MITNIKCMIWRFEFRNKPSLCKHVGFFQYLQYNFEHTCIRSNTQNFKHNQKKVPLSLVIESVSQYQIFWNSRTKKDDSCQSQCTGLCVTSSTNLTFCTATGYWLLRLSWWWRRVNILQRAWRRPPPACRTSSRPAPRDSASTRQTSSSRTSLWTISSSR